MFNFLHTYIPSSVLFHLGPLTIRWYGVLISIGALLGLYVILRLAKRYGIKEDTIYNLGFWVVLFGLIGDRLYYVFYAWEYYGQHPWDIFKIWQGGLAIHGAIIAGILVIILYAKKHRLNAWQLLDIMVMAVILGLAIGRWGNYFNQELFGRPTDLPWGIPIAPEFRPIHYIESSHFHPTFLYESLFDFMIFAVLLFWHTLRIKKIRAGRTVTSYGYIALSFLMLYSIGRGLNEFLRIDYSPFVFGIRWAQITSGAIIILVGVLWILLYRYRSARLLHQDSVRDGKNERNDNTGELRG